MSITGILTTSRLTGRVQCASSQILSLLEIRLLTSRARLRRLIDVGLSSALDVLGYTGSSRLVAVVFTGICDVLAN